MRIGRLLLGLGLVGILDLTVAVDPTMREFTVLATLGCLLTGSVLWSTEK